MAPCGQFAQVALPGQQFGSLCMCALGAHTDPMLERWHRSVLSIIGPLAYAMVVGRASRRQLVSWAETLEGVAEQMRAKAGS